MEMETTVADRIFASALQTLGLPTPQRVFRAGLKRITLKDMRDRFALDAVEKAQNEGIRKKLIAETLAKEGLTEMPANWQIREENGTNDNSWIVPSFFRSGDMPRPVMIEHWNEIRIYAPEEVENSSVTMYFDESSAYDRDLRDLPYRSALLSSLRKKSMPPPKMTRTELRVKARAAKVVTNVKQEPIEAYLEEIPDRVCASYLAARELGLTDFKVCSPVVKIAAMEQPKLPDPILVGLLGGVMFEVDYWE